MCVVGQPANSGRNETHKKYIKDIADGRWFGIECPACVKKNEKVTATQKAARFAIN